LAPPLRLGFGAATATSITVQHSRLVVNVSEPSGTFGRERGFVLRVACNSALRHLGRVAVHAPLAWLALYCTFACVWEGPMAVHCSDTCLRVYLLNIPPTISLEGRSRDGVERREVAVVARLGGRAVYQCRRVSALPVSTWWRRVSLLFATWFFL